MSENERSELDQLRYLVVNWQALANNAEVFAPSLLSNHNWLMLKANLEQRTRESGVTAFMEQFAEERYPDEYFRNE